MTCTPDNEFRNGLLDKPAKTIFLLDKPAKTILNN